MITHEYSEFFPEDDKEFSMERLMSILSDMIMKYDISLEEALKMMIERNVPVNLFLKEGGMDDLVQEFRKRIQEMMNDILSKYNFDPLLSDLQNNYNQLKTEADKKFKKNPNLKKIKEALEKRNQDMLRRLKWEGTQKPDERAIFDQLLQSVDNLDTIENGVKNYNFTGQTVPTLREAIQILKNLEQMQELDNSLKQAIESGEIFNFDLNEIARFLGPESYQEFIERREKIFEELKKLLEERGDIIQSQDGEIQLSPKSIRKIGMVALQEIFSKMKSDSASGSHLTKETGDTENATAATRPLEFGDSISHIDFSGSIVNSIIRGNGPRPRLRDLEVFEARGSAKSATVILLDMSGSMARAMRFYYAKKVVLAMDALIKSEFKDEKLVIIGFGSTAKLINVPDIPLLQPYPITIYNPYIKLRFDFAKMTKQEIENRVPLYFTNLQKGLSLSRQSLSSKQIKNKQVFLITDGAPTAHFKGSTLHINYPPTPPDFEEALNEVKLCSEEGITINTFLLTSEWDMEYFGERSFIHQFAKIAKGRIFYPHPNELNQMILYDFINNKKKKYAF